MKENTTSKSNNQYPAVDICKFICALLICMIHIAPFPNNKVWYFDSANFYLVNCLSRIAVPFYFASTSYFLFKKINITKIDTNVIKEYCFKILRLLGTWWVILFVGEKNHLWYLGGAVIAILFLTYLFKKKIKLKYIIIITIILFIIGLLGDTYYQIIRILKSNNILSSIIITYEKYFKTTRNGLFFGSIFVLIGIILSQKKIKIDLKLAYFLTFLSYSLLMLETTLIEKNLNPKDYNMYISIIPIVFFMLYMFLNVNMKDRPIYKKIRIISILIYFSHRMFIYLSKEIIDLINIHHKINLSNYHFLFTIVLTLLFSILIEKLSRTKKLQILKYLYS